MKKLILVIAAIGFAAIVSAQSAAPAPATASKPASASATAATTTPASASASHAQVWYGCPKCNFTSQKEGKCATHNLELVKDHSYACPKCGKSSDAAGKCTADGTDLAMVDCKAKMMSARKAANPPVPAIKN